LVSRVSTQASRSRSHRFSSTTLFRSGHDFGIRSESQVINAGNTATKNNVLVDALHSCFSPILGKLSEFHANAKKAAYITMLPRRSEEHTSELQSREKLVCCLLLAKQK